MSRCLQVPVMEFLDFMRPGPHKADADSMMDRLIAHDRMHRGREELVDGFSIVDLRFT